jgi:hypothetical protein
MITRLAMWWLQRQGYVLLSSSFDGAVFGNRYVYQQRNRLTVDWPEEHGELILLNHSYLIQEEKQK